MACVNNVRWCSGPAGFGNKCLKCQTSGTSAAKPTPNPKPAHLIGSPKPVAPAKLEVPRPVTPPAVVQAPTLLSVTEAAGPAPEGHKFYRGDTRAPSQLRGGFSAWVPLSAAQARALIQRYTGSSGDIELPRQARSLQDATNSAGRLKLLDLVREIKREKNHTTVHISTDLTEECGGYASGYIYEMTFPRLNTLSTSNVVTVNASSVVCTSTFNSIVVFDGSSLDSATTIAISSNGNEVSFLTSIPYANISRYKEPGSSVWKAMPA